MTVFACRSCGAAVDRPCVDTECSQRKTRAQSIRAHLNSYRPGNSLEMPEHRIRRFGIEGDIPPNWREILEAGADD